MIKEIHINHNEEETSLIQTHYTTQSPIWFQISTTVNTK